MQMTPIQLNKMLLLKHSIVKAMRKLITHGERQSVRQVTGLRTLNDALARGIDNLFTEVSGKAKPPGSMSDISRPVSIVIAETLAYLYTGGEGRRFLESEVLRDLHKNGNSYELLSQMPPAKAERKPRPKRTLVQSRADKVNERLADWEAKLRRAKTAVAKYRKKQRYYQKKGATT
jgi:hypothetical protein